MSMKFDKFITFIMETNSALNIWSYNLQILEFPPSQLDLNYQVKRPLKYQSFGS